MTMKPMTNTNTLKPEHLIPGGLFTMFLDGLFRTFRVITTDNDGTVAVNVNDADDRHEFSTPYVLFHANAA